MTMFNNAPALSGTDYGTRSDGAPPDDIAAGIQLHIDGGPIVKAGKPNLDQAHHPFSVNMGTGSLQGGDRIGTSSNKKAWVHVLYFGVPGSITLPGVNTRSLS